MNIEINIDDYLVASTSKEKLTRVFSVMVTEEMKIKLQELDQSVLPPNYIPGNSGNGYW